MIGCSGLHARQATVTNGWLIGCLAGMVNIAQRGWEAGGHWKDHWTHWRPLTPEGCRMHDCPRAPESDSSTLQIHAFFPTKKAFSPEHHILHRHWYLTSSCSLGSSWLSELSFLSGCASTLSMDTSIERTALELPCSLKSLHVYHRRRGGRPTTNTVAPTQATVIIIIILGVVTIMVASVSVNFPMLWGEGA